MNKVYHMFLIFVAILLMPAIALAAEQKAYVIGIDSNNDKLEVQDVIVTIANVIEDTYDELSAYRLKVISVDNNVLYETKFDFSSPYEYKEVVIPYFLTGKEIIIYNKEGKLLLNESVIHFADVCKDNICQPHESYESCPQDCKSGGRDDYCDALADKKCDPDCTAKQDIDCISPIMVTKMEKGIGAPWIIGGGVLLFVITAIGVFVYSHLKKPQ